VVGPETLTLFTREDCREAIVEHVILSSTRILDLSTPGVPIFAYEALSGRPQAFLLSIDSGGEGRVLECFDPKTEELREVWADSIRAASTTPKQIEAYIDDFSDVEDDTHARRSSLESTDGLDWAHLDQAVIEQNLDGIIPEDGGEVRMSAIMSVKEAAIAHDGQESDDPEEDEVGKRSSLEEKDGIDWSTVHVSRARSRKSTDGSARSDKSFSEARFRKDSDGPIASEQSYAVAGTHCDEAEHIDAVATAPLSTSAMEAIYGECW
jgi:hypothetical protein